MAFIAVSSGNSSAAVNQYVRKHRIPWPVIVDSDRSFEKACGVGEISLSNIYQARVITPTGQLARANGAEIEQAANRALEGAQWNVDPGKMTAELQSAWLQIEFGKFAPAATSVKRYLKARKTEVNAAANLLNAYVDGEKQKRLDAAASADTAGDSWKAYMILAEVKQQFKGYDLPPNVATDLTRLSRVEDVVNQLAAYRKLELAKKSVASSSRTARARAGQALQKLIDDFPDTDAAAEATAILSAP